MASAQPKPEVDLFPPIFEVDSVPIPPGTKNHAKLPRGLEQETSPTRFWPLVVSGMVAALIVGILIGRSFF